MLSTRLGPVFGRVSISGFKRASTIIPFARSLHSSSSEKAVKVVRLQVDSSSSYPTLFRGLNYEIDVFGKVNWTTSDQKLVQEAIWNNRSFLPNRPASSLDGTDFAVLSRIAAAQAVKLADNSSGLVAKNELRKTVHQELVEKESQARLFYKFLSHLKDFQSRPSAESAQLISDVAFWCQWLIRGYLFEPKLHGEQFTSAVIPAPLSTIAYASNAALGRHQIEFVYDDYTLKAANFPKNRRFEDLDYDEPEQLLRYIADIETPVGFCDMAGGNPEHNFRHNHSLMEQQMKHAFAGWDLIRRAEATADEVLKGWTMVAEAAERAHKTFNTMMTGTPAASYPSVRLMIKGVRGACGTVYPPHGVFYEGCGSASFSWATPGSSSPKQLAGCFVDREFGQTGANSSMYKWFDVLIGVTKQRHAYDLNEKQIATMKGVLLGDQDPGNMGSNPIDSMQRAFDLLTRPPLHLEQLVRLAEQVEASPHLLDVKSDPRLADNWELIALQRFKLAYFVASHRNVHGKYVLKMIYETTPVGGQSRAEGTGGSTPPFLKLFFDQTFMPAMEIASDLLGAGRKEVLGKENIREVREMRDLLVQEMEQMARVQNKGLALEREEKRGVGVGKTVASASGAGGKRQMATNLA